MEIPLKGDTPFIKKRNPKTGCPLFNAPERLASALKKYGFDVLCTANNHEIPSPKQKKLVKALFRQGADIILGSHPHVLQPLIRTRSNKLAIFSLGNFISIRLKKNPYTNNGLILKLTVRKEECSRITITDVNWVPTWTLRKFKNGSAKYRILPNQQKEICIRNVREDVPLRLLN